jgi:N-acetylglucosaminyl-diphospho-decaprenol L-rhamnosyltransferase
MDREGDALVEILTVIVNYRTPELTIKCIDALAIERGAGLSLRAIVADGCSSDDSVSRIAEHLRNSGYEEWVELLPLDFNGGFGWANNKAILHSLRDGPSASDFIYLLNPDAVVTSGAVGALLHRLHQTPAAAAVGSQLLEPNGEKAASAFPFPSLRREFARASHIGAMQKLFRVKPPVTNFEAPSRVDWVTGASVMLRSEALAQTGLFDDGFFLYFEEVELMHRLSVAGWEIWCEPESRVKHIGGAATGVNNDEKPKALPDYWFRSRLRYFARTGGTLGAVMANIAWFSGFVFSGLLRLQLSSKVRDRSIPGEARGIWKAGWRARPPSAPTLRPQPYSLPAWARQND